MALLELTKVVKRFGGLTAVNDVNLAIEEGSLCGLIGPNGAGKTTVFNLLTGVYLRLREISGLMGRVSPGGSPTAFLAQALAEPFRTSACSESSL